MHDQINQNYILFNLINYQKCQLIQMIIDAIAGPFYNIIKVMMKGPNKRSNLNINHGRGEVIQE